MASREQEPPPPNVIHVSFTERRVLRRVGAGAVANTNGDPAKGAPSAGTATNAGPPRFAPRDADPVSRVYTRRDLARILGTSLAQVRAWERATLLRASAEERGAARYTFADLLTARALSELRDKGVSTARTRRVVEGLRRALPGLRSLAEARVWVEGHSVRVHDERGAFEPETGQRVLDFSARSVRSAVLAALPLAPRPRGDTRTAYEWFLEGCRLDADEATRERAVSAYERAIALDDTLAAAHTNLGMLALARDDRREAELRFRRAIALDAGQPEAPYNLAWLLLESDRVPEAVKLLEVTVALAPEFADAHVNLALALEAVGRRVEALAHWKSYLALEPQGTHAPAALARLGKRDR